MSLQCDLQKMHPSNTKCEQHKEEMVTNIFRLPIDAFLQKMEKRQKTRKRNTTSKECKNQARKKNALEEATMKDDSPRRHHNKIVEANKTKQ